jgi:hypothetical protein
MKGDFSRLLFEPKKHYRGVLNQMGRVLTDNDHNAEHLIHDYLDRIASHDIVGGAGVPKTPAGQFQIGIAGGGGDLTVGAGRAYVEGLICETDGSTLLQQPHSPYGATLASVTELAAGGPGVYLAYLDVWERHVTALEDPSIREIALGGPDTTTRIETVWQLRVMKIGAPGNYPTCANAVFNPISVSSGRMSASVDVNPPPPNSCAVVPQTGYRGLENQLYRIEIHLPGRQNAGPGEPQATFKWSRDNGSVVASVLSGGGVSFNVDSIGRDDVLGFAIDNWVELIADAGEFSLGRGELRQVGGVTRQPPEIQLRSAAPAGFGAPNTHAKIRRWNQTGGAAVADGIPLNQSPSIAIEDGISVSFQPGDYRSGDYWLVPARTSIGDAAGSIEWPNLAGSWLALPPRGIVHQFAPLGIVEYTGTAFVAPPGGVTDCRDLFAPLTEPQRINVQGQGVFVAETDTLNFTGSGVTTNYDPANHRVNINIPGGGGDCCHERRPTRLLYPFVSNQGAYDTGITVANTTASPFGPEDQGLCRVYYFGVSAGAPAAPTMFYLRPGQMAAFALSSGGNVPGAYPTQFIPGNRGFQGYMIIECDFAGAYGYAEVRMLQLGVSNSYTAIVLPPRLSACKAEFPYGYVPLSDAGQIVGPDSRGDFVAFGRITLDNYRKELDLALPDYPDQLYCSAVRIAPSLVAQTYVPSAEERRGDFSRFDRPIIDPNTGGPFPNNVIPASRLGTVMAWRYRASQYQTASQNSSAIGVLNLLR